MISKAKLLAHLHDTTEPKNTDISEYAMLWRHWAAMIVELPDDPEPDAKKIPPGGKEAKSLDEERALPSPEYQAMVWSRVKEGAKLLDEREPSWWRWISLSTLDMSKGCSDILGQLALYREKHGMEIGEDVNDDPWNAGIDYYIKDCPNAHMLGYTLHALQPGAWAMLTTMWTDMIAEKRNHCVTPG